MASEEIAIAYAAWISAEFHLDVIQVFLAYRRGELVHSSTPPELRSRLDSLVEAKAKGLITGFAANEMALEAIRSNWHKLPALPSGDTNTMPIFQVLLRTQVKVSGAAFLEPRMMTVYEAAVTAKDGEYGSDERTEKKVLFASQSPTMITAAHAAFTEWFNEHNNKG